MNKKNIDKIQINNYNLFYNNKSQKSQYFAINKTIKDEEYKYHIYNGDKMMILRKEKPENKIDICDRMLIEELSKYKIKFNQ